jgi:hypothetical protein
VRAESTTATIAVMEKKRRMQWAANIRLVATLNQPDCSEQNPLAMPYQQKGKTLYCLLDIRVP